MSMSRRGFLGGSAAAVVAAGTMAKGTVFGANDRIGVLCVGLNGRGNSHMKDVMDNAGAEIVALCDVDERVLERAAKNVEKGQGKAPKTYRDLREALADESIHAVSIATPNHQHTLQAMWACKAGKDVYVEKPLSHSVWEGRQLAAAAKKYERIVQHGTQARSDGNLRRDMALLHQGFIGKVMHSRGYVYKNGNRNAIGKGVPGEAPPWLDWTLWQGPAQEKPFLLRDGKKMGLQVPYNWHWFWEYGNGEIGNQGVHEMDIAVWGHNRGLPVKVSSTGGRYGWDDDGETPNTQATQFTYADGSMMTFEVRNLGSFQEADSGDCSDSFFGTEGYYVRRKGFFDYRNRPIEVSEPAVQTTDMWENFFAAMRSRDASTLYAPVDAGHEACIHCHVGNVAYRVGHTLNFDPATERFAEEDANAYLKRVYREGFEPETLA
jgi:predicted dehydrogenase